MTTTLTAPTIPEINTMIRDAIEQTPPRRHRRIWIEGPRVKVADNGVPVFPMRQGLPEGIEVARLLGGVVSGVIPGHFITRDGANYGDAEIIRLYADVHIRHGWTLVDGYPTSCEARLWRAA